MGERGDVSRLLGGVVGGFGEGVTCHIRCGVVAGCIGVKMSAAVVLMSLAELCRV